MNAPSNSSTSTNLDEYGEISQRIGRLNFILEAKKAGFAVVLIPMNQVDNVASQLRDFLMADVEEFMNVKPIIFRLRG